MMIESVNIADYTQAESELLLVNVYYSTFGGLFTCRKKYPTVIGSQMSKSKNMKKKKSSKRDGRRKWNQTNDGNVFSNTAGDENFACKF